MSLDVYLSVETPIERKPTSGIFVRESGETREISADEWNARCPDREPVRVIASAEPSETTEVFSANVTHNLGRMADAAGIYEALWRPEEIGVSKASQLVPLLEKGLAKLEAHPDEFLPMNPVNGWGSYERFVPWVRNYLQACREYPDATIRVSR